MLARVLAMALCPSVCLCLSVCHKSVLFRNGCTNWAGFWHGSFLPLVLPVWKRNSNYGISKNKGTSFWNFVSDSGLLLWYIDRRSVLSAELKKGGCSEHDKLDHCQSTKLTIPLSSDPHPLVYHSNHQAVSTAQFCCAGQLATCDTCCQHSATYFNCRQVTRHL